MQILKHHSMHDRSYGVNNVQYSWIDFEAELDKWRTFCTPQFVSEVIVSVVKPSCGTVHFKHRAVAGQKILEVALIFMHRIFVKLSFAFHFFFLCYIYCIFKFFTFRKKSGPSPCYGSETTFSIWNGCLRQICSWKCLCLSRGFQRVLTHLS